MGHYRFDALISQQTASTSVVLCINRDSRPGCLSVIGTLGAGETIDIQIPLNTDPEQESDSHWQTLYQDGSPLQITSTNHAIAIPVGMTVRVVKNATAEAVGLRWT